VKFKCPRCKIRYCGVDCFKKHDPTICEVRKRAPSTAEESSSTTATASKRDSEEDQGSLLGSDVPKRHLKLLAESSEVRQLLTDPKLRTMIFHVDNSPNPNDALNYAMKDKYFQQFATACLDIVESGEVVRPNKVSEMSNEELIEVWRKELKNLKS